uniref:Uncharacterized protein n=1 Tax=Rhizophora mucronata TaxID=61149 RepID=A0A2P2P7M7_RHIMU
MDWNRMVCVQEMIYHNKQKICKMRDNNIYCLFVLESAPQTQILWPLVQVCYD